MTIGVLAVSVAAPRAALAADAGGGENGTDAATSDDGATKADGGADSGCDEGGVDEAGVCCDNGGACSAPAASVHVPPIIACDGALCDTLQGRPEFSCSVASNSVGGVSSDTCIGAAIALGVCVARRAKRGASRPRSGGGAC